MFLPMMFGSGRKGGNFSQWISSMAGKTTKAGVWSRRRRPWRKG